MALTPAIFLDKDGTVLADVPYNVDKRQMRFAPGARAGLERLARLGLPIIIISNQPGVALGKFAPEALLGVREQLSDMFAQAGARLDGFYYCPHHPRGLRHTYTMMCECRKPAPGLLYVAAERHGIDLFSSWFVGDILDDVEAGRRAGCRTILLDNGNETEWRRNEWRTPERTEKDLEGASLWIEQHKAELSDDFLRNAMSPDAAPLPLSLPRANPEVLNTRSRIPSQLKGQRTYKPVSRAPKTGRTHHGMMV